VRRRASPGLPPAALATLLLASAPFLGAGVGLQAQAPAVSIPASAACADSVALTGRVVTEAGEPRRDASVSLPGLQKRVVTDASFNVLTPRSARACRQGGRPVLLRVLLQ